MAQTIKLKRSATSGATPTTSQLELGEVAINTYDGKMYIKKNVGGTESIVEITGGSGGSSTLGGLSDVTISSAAADQLLQYNGSEWVNVSIAEASAIMKEYQFTATSGQSTFSGSDNNSETLSYTAGAIQVFLNGIFLDSAVDYTATNGTSVVLSETVDANDYLQVVAFKKKIGDGSVSVDTFTGNGSTTAFTLSVDPGDENNTRVFVDGVYQSKSNYSVSGTTLTFSTAPPADTAVEVEIGNRVVTLDTLSDLDLPDDVKLRLGTSQDLQIYHDGSNSYIKDTGTGDLIVEGSNNIWLMKAGGSEVFLNTYDDGAVQLYHDNSVKFATTSSGISVTGNIANTSGDMTLDVIGDIILDADGGDILLKDGGTFYGFLGKSGNDFVLKSQISDGDFVIKGSDAGSTITALTLDMSAAGTAIFNSHVDLSDSKYLRLGNDADFIIYHDGSTNYVQAIKQDSDIIFRGNDGGTNFNALTLDMSDVGTAHFNGHIRLGDNRTASFGAGYDIEITSDGTNGTIGAPNGNLTLDVAGSIVFDADNTGLVDFKDGGTHFGRIENASSDFKLESRVQDKDIVLVGNDGGTGVEALRLDMSEAGAATFNAGSTFSGNLAITAGSGQRYIEIASGTSNAKTYRIYNGISWNPDALLIYNHTDDNTVLTIEPNKLGVNRGANSLSHTLDVGGNIAISGTEIVTTSRTITNIASLTVTGTNANLTLGTTGNNITFGRNGDNYIEAQAGTSSNIVIDPQNRFVVRTNDTERFRIDSSGNILHQSGSPEYHFGTTSASHYNWRVAAQEAVDAGFEIASGTQSAGSAALSDTYTTRFVIKGDTGNVGIGINSPSTPLAVQSNSSAQGITILGRSSDDISQLDFVENDGTSIGGFQARTTDFRIRSVQNLPLLFMTNNTERVRVDTSGNFLVGTTNTVPGVGNTVAGISLYNDGRIFASKSGNATMSLNRNTDDGNILEFRRQGSTIGSITSRAGAVTTVIFDPRTNGSGITGTTNGVLPTNQAGSPTSDHVDLGSNTNKFKDLHLSGHINMFGNTNQINGGVALYLDSDNTVFRKDNETEIMRFSGTNVGIGTSSPAGALHIHGGAYGEQFISSSNSAMRFVSTGGVNYIQSGTATSSSSAADLIFTNVGGSGETMRIDSGGRVGIGQTPLSNNFSLQVTGLGGGSGDARAVYLKGSGAHTSIGSTGPTLVLQNTNSTVNNIVKLSFESASSGETVSINAINTNHSSHYGDMAFNTRGSSGYSEKMRIMANGNVGIGTAAPATGTHTSYQNLVIGETTSSTSGLSFKASTSGQSAIFFSDGVTPFNRGQVLYDHSTDSLTLASNGVEKLRLDGSGQTNVRLGGSTTNGTTVLSSCTSTSSSGGNGTGNTLELEFMEPSSPNFGAKKLRLGVQGGGYVKMDFPGSAGLYAISPYQANDKFHIGYGGIQLDMNGGGYGGNQHMLIRCLNDITFHPGGSERWRMIGHTSSTPSVFVTNQTTVTNIGGTPPDLNSLELGPGYINLNRDDTVSATQIQFGKNGSVAGSIVTTSSTTYNTTSDRRAKENIVDAQDAGELIDGIRVREFDWKNSGEHQRYGMVAQELLEVAPEVVHQPEDEEQMMGVDYSKLVPMLVKALQESRQEINNLKSRVEELESQ